MEILVKVIQFFICFTLLVGIHEFGHFIVARLFKIRVDKFYIFFDPWFSICKWKRGDTEYGLGWLPLGGYCKIAGMIDESMDTEQMAQPAKPDEFRSKPAWQRLCVMVAGVVMNLLLAIAIYIGVSYVWGESYLPTKSAEWGYEFNECGEAMGLVDGDKIISIDGEAITDVSMIVTRLVLSDNDRELIVERGGEQLSLTIPLTQLVDMRKEKGHIDFLSLRMPFIIDSVVAESSSALLAGDEIVAINGEPQSGFMAFREVISSHKGETLSISVLRGGEVSIFPIPVDDEGRIGVMTRSPYQMESREYTLLQSIPAGFKRAGASMSSYWGQLSLIFQPKTEMYRELGGFVAIGNMFSSVWNWQDFWLKTAFLSIMLGVMNILPIPGLDGGHSLFTIFEMVTGRKPSDKFLEVTQYAGMLLLFTLLIYANGNDFYRLIFG
ncbi:MAG: RIP metalloprotease RseP [Rikenellaceae bacterium]